MKAGARLALTVAVLWLAVRPVAADVVFPARLDVVETEPGQYAVTFTLPVVEGRILRAEPAMPPTCRDLTERTRAASFGGVTTTWSVACEPPSLAGEAILVEGLLGTQIELAFSLSTLDGRVFNEILKPSRPGFLVPQPPSLASLASDAGVEGVRWVLARTDLWLLMLIVGLAGVRSREHAAAIAAFAVASATAQWLVGQGWLQVAPPVAEFFILLTAAVPAVRIAGGDQRWQGWIHPLWPVMLLIGAVVGGAGGVAVSTEGLSRGEQIAAFGLFAFGTSVGLAWLTLVALELRTILARAADGRWRGPVTRLLGYCFGSLATGMLLARLVALALLVEDSPLRALSLVVAAVVLAPFLATAGSGARWTVPAFTGLASLGLASGLARVALPHGDLLVSALALAVGMCLLLARAVPRPLRLVIAALTVVTCSWWGTLALVDNVSRSRAASVGMLVVATMVFFIGFTLWQRLQLAVAALPNRVVGLTVALGIGLWRLVTYWIWFEREVATTAALGLLRLPLAALVLFAVALLLWPRRRQVLVELGVERRRPVWHWVALTVAFLAVPYGTLAVRNPFYEPQAPRGEDARRVVSAVLFDTYRAFNLSDEEEVFDRLADSVTGDLVEDVYLDSRRRLTAGTRQGTEVTVRDVSVVEIGDPREELAGSGAFTYDCRWVVTSRVRHLQHIHHRQNIYSGALILTIDDGRWKIAGVELTSEDRVVLSAQQT